MVGPIMSCRYVPIGSRQDKVKKMKTKWAQQGQLFDKFEEEEEDGINL